MTFEHTQSRQSLASVIVCSLNGERVLPVCLASLLASDYAAFEVIVVDNGSTDSTAALVRSDFPAVRLVQSGRNLGFAGGNNLGIAAARGEIIILLNDDTEAPPGWLAAVTGPFARDGRIGAVGCKLLYPDRRTIQHAGTRLRPNANTDHLRYGEEDRGQWDRPGEQPYVTGAALALRRAALEQVGLLDPAFYPIYFEEVDLQTRLARAGWKIWYEPAAWLVHFESQSQGVASPRFVYRYTRNRLRYLALHGFPEGAWRGLREEARFLRHMRRQGRLAPMLRAYAAGALHGFAWRLDRRARRTVPVLPGRC
ncbi:MAG: glycosyltransferase family 2 protein [bacterium]|nr:glycosyltransferase family 2 protein [bacterium]